MVERNRAWYVHSYESVAQRAVASAAQQLISMKKPNQAVAGADNYQLTQFAEHARLETLYLRKAIGRGNGLPNDEVLPLLIKNKTITNFTLLHNVLHIATEKEFNKRINSMVTLSSELRAAAILFQITNFTD